MFQELSWKSVTKSQCSHVMYNVISYKGSLTTVLTMLAIVWVVPGTLCVLRLLGHVYVNNLRKHLRQPHNLGLAI